MPDRGEMQKGRMRFVPHACFNLECEGEEMSWLFNSWGGGYILGVIIGGAIMLILFS